MVSGERAAGPGLQRSSIVDLDSEFRRAGQRAHRGGQDARDEQPYRPIGRPRRMNSPKIWSELQPELFS